MEVEERIFGCREWISILGGISSSLLRRILPGIRSGSERGGVSRVETRRHAISEYAHKFIELARFAPYIMQMNKGKPRSSSEDFELIYKKG